MTYQPKTTAEERNEARTEWASWLETMLLDDLTACEAALAERQEILRSYLMEFAKAEARITELEQMVRELVEAVDQCFGNVAISMDNEIVWANTRAKALALLQPQPPERSV